MKWKFITFIMIYDTFAILNWIFPPTLYSTTRPARVELCWHTEISEKLQIPKNATLFAGESWNWWHFPPFLCLQANNTFKRPSPDPYIGNDSPNRNNSTMKPKAAPVRKPKASKKKKKKDPNEPQK